MKPRSLRRRFTALLAIGLATIVGAAGLYTTGRLAARATEEFDAALLRQARALAALTERERGHVELDYVPASMPEFEREVDPQQFQIWLDDGTVLYRSKRLSGDLPRAAAFPSTPDAVDARLSDGRAGRVARIAFMPSTSQDVGDDKDPSGEAGAPPPRALFLSVARSREGLDATIAAMRWQVLGAAAVAALLAVVLAWRALARAFAPVEAIASQVRALDADRLASRVAVAGTPAELAPIVSQVNALLDRMALSLDRERRFAGNVAHELRTPIAELRSLCAVASRWPGDGEANARFFEDAGAVARRMERLVADLLLLSRCQAGAEPVVRAPVSLRRLLGSAAASPRAAASDRGLVLRVDVPDDLGADSDEGKLGIVLGNLLGNAVAYALPGTEVRCTATRDGARFRVEVENAAEPLAPEDLSRLTEPFWRADAARSSPEHAGLGLSLVAALAPLLGLEVAFEQRDGTFLARVAGPACDVPAEPEPPRPPAPPRDRQATLRSAPRMDSQGGAP